MARYSISGNKKKALRDRRGMFRGWDRNLFRKDCNLSFRGGGSLPAEKFTLKEKPDPDKYMDLK